MSQPVATQPAGQTRICLKCGHEERFSDNEGGYCEKSTGRAPFAHVDIPCGCLCVFPAPEGGEPELWYREFVDWLDKEDCGDREQLKRAWATAIHWANSRTPQPSPSARCVHCDPSFKPEGPDDWCSCACHLPAQSPEEQELPNDRVPKLFTTAEWESLSARSRFNINAYFARADSPAVAAPLTPVEDKRLKEIQSARNCGIYPWSHLSLSNQQLKVARQTIDYLLTRLAQPDAQARRVPPAVAGGEPSPSAREAAREIVRDWFMEDGAIDVEQFVPLKNALIERITTAIEAGHRGREQQ